LNRGDFLEKNKKYLLSCAESAAKFINERGYGSFLSLLLDIIEVSENKFKDENQGKQYFCEVINKNKNSRVNTVLGGGKALSDSFKQFIEVFLQVSKEKEGYVIKNKAFKDLTLKELKYVLGWSRRLIVEQTDKKKKIANSRNNGDFKKRSFESNKRTNKNLNGGQNKNLFNNSLAAQLENSFKNNQ